MVQVRVVGGFFPSQFFFFLGIGWDYSPEVYSESKILHEYGRFIHIIHLSQLRINIPYGAFGNEMPKMTWSEKNTNHRDVHSKHGYVGYRIS